MQILAFLPGSWEWIVILVIAVLIFGRRLPEIARGVGKSITEFKKGVRDSENEIHQALDDADRVASDSSSQKTEKQDNPS